MNGEPAKLTEEQEKDVTERIDKFKAAYKALVAEHQVDMSSEPHYIPTGPYMYGTAIGVTYIDLKYRNPSPILSNEAPQENQEPS